MKISDFWVADFELGSSTKKNASIILPVLIVGVILALHKILKKK
jgi:hypothetical protein